MCLLRDPSVKIKGNKVWKILTRDFESIMYPYKWKPGWNEAILQEEKSEIFVHSGFHVYLNRKDTIGYGLVIEFTFDMADLIATGVHDSNTSVKQAVFKRLHLSEEIWKENYLTGKAGMGIMNT